jgi:hypothetical protein
MGNSILEYPGKLKGAALASPDLVLEAQPPAQPHSGVVVARYAFVTVPTSKSPISATTTAKVLHPASGPEPSNLIFVKEKLLSIKF